jgi:hypothetical protein
VNVNKEFLTGNFVDVEVILAITDRGQSQNILEHILKKGRSFK